MEISPELLKRCHVNKNDEGDRFVGVKADSENAMVYFPVGYKLPETDEEIRRDIIHLIAVLAEFTNRSDMLLAMQKFEAPQSVDFPINAYMTVINYYLEQNAYYTEKEPTFKTSDRGKIDWPQTLRKQRPLFQPNGSPVFTQYTVRHNSPNDNNLITQIHKYCVYESFQKLGWLFTSDVPPRPTIEKNTKMFLSVLNDKLAKTNNDKDKRLFSAMISMLNYIDEQTSQKQFYFGTDSFEYVWEKLIDRVFGVRDKEKYFPRTRWILRGGRQRDNYALEPDTIMLCNNKIYVLDAKYYRYGITGNPQHLPESTSINKQITYGEYIATQERFIRQYGGTVPVYNAFLMPYSREKNPFGLTTVFGNIGEASGDWKGNDKAYERVQGIVVDVRYLIFERTWHDPRRYARLLSEFRAVMTPDFSLFTDYPRSVQIYNHYRKHLIGAYWQSMGMTVIPSICWSHHDSFEWCFDGEPVGGCVAVSSVGTQKSPTARALFMDGYNEMLRRLNPEKIIFFGDVPSACEGNIERHDPFYKAVHARRRC